VGHSTGVCAKGKWWQWALLCHPVAAWQLMTLMTTTSWPHRGKAAAATELLYGESSGCLATAVTAHIGWFLLTVSQCSAVIQPFLEEKASGNPLVPKTTNGK